MKQWAKSFYQSKAWKDTRKAYFIYKFGVCERCGKPGEIVHHQHYLTKKNINDPSVTLNFANLELLCQKCHNFEHMHTSNIGQKGLGFDENGNLIRKN